MIHSAIIGSRFRITFFGLAMSASIWFSGCSGTKDAAGTATLTFKDGSHFAGTIVRREASSITLVDGSGSTRTFLYTELADIRYSTPQSDAKPSASAQQSSQIGGSPAPTESPEAGAGGLEEVRIPVGTEFPVTTNGYLDSCCVPLGAFSVGTLESDLHVGGKVVLPRGSKVTIMLADENTTDGRTFMRFEIGAANAGGHNYVISSEKGGLEPGLSLTLKGEKAGTPEARAHGTNVHLDDHDLMTFRAVTPTDLKLSR